MAPIVEPKVRNSQAPKVRVRSTNFQCVAEIDVKQQFAARLHALCDDMQLPRGRGRQSALAAKFGVSPNADRTHSVTLDLPQT